MFFKNAILYRIPQYWNLPADQIEQALQQHIDTPIGSFDAVSRGWVAAQGEQLVYTQGQHVLLKLRINKKLLPVSVVSTKVKEEIEAIKEREGYTPGRKQIKEIKEDVIQRLLPTAFVVSKDTPIWIDTKAGWLVVGTSSAAVAETCVSMLIKSLEKLPLETLYVAKPIAQTLTDWLATGDAPEQFTVDQDAVLAEKGSKAKVRYTQHNLEGQDLQLHLEQGKQCTQLAMTWKDRVSFVINEKAQLKKINALDVIEETRNQEEDSFASDFALMTGELSSLIGALIEAFGGLAKQEKEATKTPAQDDDCLLEQAVSIIKAQNRASISLIQRHLRIGYNRAARLIETMEQRGIVSPMDTSGNRTVLQGI